VRGVDTILPHYDFIASWDVLSGLRRAFTRLGSLAAQAQASGRTRDAAALRRNIGAIRKAGKCLSGDYDVPHMERFTAKRRTVGWSG